MNTRKASLIVLTLGVASTLAACISDSDAGSGASTSASEVSKKDFDALVARVDELEATVARLVKSTNTVIVKGSASGMNGMSKQQKLAYAIPANCTASSYVPDEYLLARGVECKADTGVIYSHPFKGGKPADVLPVLHATSDCSDDGYVRASQISGTNMETHGAVFQSDQRRVVWVPANPARTTATIVAQYDSAFGCQQYNPATEPDSLVAVQPNDPGLSGVDNNLPAIEVVSGQ